MAQQKQKFVVTNKIVAGIIVLIVVIALLSLWGIYNSLVGKDQRVESQWANVESQYQRRADLVPNLVSSVRGYMQFERDLLTDITELRSRWTSATTQSDKIQYGTALDSAISRLLLVYENYPELKSDETVKGLMDELSGTENRIAVERMRYNDAVRDYNTATRTFPGSLVANWFGFQSRLYFSAQPGTDVVPPVNIYP